ncbi:ClpXP protease specificity-enhancing factor SspB [Pajaroellobacter abortibovis]|nr:ClpXP protease specificity-enhancing factor SspB [Pajaroellobacter abortibovis]
MNASYPPLPPKKNVILALLELSTVFIHLDPRREGVAVPPWLKRQFNLVLQIGFHMPIPIPDLKIDEKGVHCTLSFQRSPFFCVLPWSSIYALVGGEGSPTMLWPEDIPPEVIAQARSYQEEQPAVKGKKTDSSKSTFEVISPLPDAQGAERVSSEKEALEQPSSPLPTGRKEKRKLPPYLRVIK